MSHTNSGFASLGLAEPLLQAIQESGYTEPTPIQQKSIPVILDGHDILAAAQTGTGKTAGFTVPILQYLFDNKAGKPKPGKPRCLILTPTRELAAQIGASVQVYGKHVPIRSTVVFGGVKYERQLKALRRPTEILIATPGRLLDLVNRRDLNLSDVEVLVLDEADRMLDMGFIHDVKKICSMVAKDRQTLMFSATFSKQIRSLAKTLLRDPKEVSVAKTNVTTELVKQTVHLVDKSGKRALLSHLITENKWDQVLVFTRTKHGANRLAQQLTDDRIRSDAFHGNKSQAARTRALENFKNGKIRVLVATDIAARGIDIHQLPQVVNFDLPMVAEDYVHRIGRTGRAGSNGQAVSLVGIDELKLLADIEKLIKQEIEVVDVEDFTGHTGSPAPEKTKKQRQRKPSRGGEGGRSSARTPKSQSKASGRRPKARLGQGTGSDQSKAGSRKPKARTAQGKTNDQSKAGSRKPKARTNQGKSTAAGTAPFKKRKPPKRKPRTSAA